MSSNLVVWVHVNVQGVQGNILSVLSFKQFELYFYATKVEKRTYTYEYI